MRVGLSVAVDIAVGKEIVAVAHRLHQREGRIEDQRNRRDEAELRRRIKGSRDARREIGEDQRHDGEDRQGRERSADAGALEALLVMADRAAQEAEAHQQVQDHHHRSEHRVARQCLRLFGLGLHQRQDQPDLDHRHREREDQRAERLADAVRNDLGMMDRSDDGPRQDHADEDRVQRQGKAGHRGNEAQDRENIVGAACEAKRLGHGMSIAAAFSDGHPHRKLMQGRSINQCSPAFAGTHGCL